MEKLRVLLLLLTPTHSSEPGGLVLEVGSVVYNELIQGESQVRELYGTVIDRMN